MTAADVVIVGSSPNALAAALSLARGGKQVVVVESDARVGGPVMTEEFAPGFHGNTGVPSVPFDLLVASTLGLELDFVSRGTVARLGSGPVPKITTDPAFCNAVILVASLDRVTPPTLDNSGDALRLIGRSLLGLGEREMHEALRLLFISARDYCAQQKDLPEAARVLLAGAACRVRAAGPFSPGTLFGALQQGAADDLLYFRSMRGGVQQLPRTLADAATRAGVVIMTGTTCVVDLDGDVANGVTLSTGEQIAAPTILSDLDARATFTQLVSPSELEPETKRALRTLRYRGTVARIQLALRDLPKFTGLDEEALRGTLVAAETIDDLERNWDEAKRGKIPTRPYIEVSIPTLDDPSLAPAGKHVVDLWVQHIPYSITDRAAVLSRVLDTLAPHAPNLADLVLHHHVMLPRDLEQRFGLTEGHLYGGELSLEQSFLLRPFSGCTGYQTPIRGLYLCGSAAHPGGYTGRSGWNVAGELLTTR